MNNLEKYNMILLQTKIHNPKGKQTREFINLCTHNHCKCNVLILFDFLFGDGGGRRWLVPFFFAWRGYCPLSFYFQCLFICLLSVVANIVFFCVVIQTKKKKYTPCHWINCCIRAIVNRCDMVNTGFLSRTFVYWIRLYNCYM